MFPCCCSLAMLRDSAQTLNYLPYHNLNDCSYEHQI